MVEVCERLGRPIIGVVAPLEAFAGGLSLNIWAQHDQKVCELSSQLISPCFGADRPLQKMTLTFASTLVSIEIKF